MCQVSLVVKYMIPRGIIWSKSFIYVEKNTKIF